MSLSSLTLATKGKICGDGLSTIALATKGKICDFIIIDDSVVVTRRPSVGKGGISFPIDNAIQIFITKGISKTTIK
jgi:hypothetical protein